MKSVSRSEAAHRNKITLLSWVLSVSVMLRHSVNLEVYAVAGWLDLLEEEIIWLTDICVPCFFAVSGYLFYRSYSPAQLPRKLRSRFFSLVIPYLIWNLIGWLYFEFLCSVPFLAQRINTPAEPFTLTNLLLNTVVGYHNVLWFIQVLILYTVTVPLIFPLLKRPVGAAAVMAAAMAASIAAPVLLPAEGRAIINLPFYLMGACAGIHFDRAVRRSFPKTARAAALLLIAATAQLDLTGSLRWLQLPIQLLQILCVWIAADWLATEKAPGWNFQLSFSSTAATIWYWNPWKKFSISLPITAPAAP